MFLEILRHFEGTAVWNLFQYLTFRAALGAVCAFVIALWLGPPVIRYLRARKIGEDTKKTDSERLSELHGDKAGTPTRGGVLVLAAVLGSVLLFGDMRNVYVQLTLLGTLALGFVGFIDDWIKLNYKDRPGLRAASKMGLQVAVSFSLAVAVVMLAVRGGDVDPYQVQLPFVKDLYLDLSGFGGLIYLVFATVVMVGSSNAVNLTDGLDGLAVGCALLAGGAFAVALQHAKD